MTTEEREQLVDLLKDTGQALALLPTIDAELRAVQLATLRSDVRTVVECADRARRMIRRLVIDMDVADYLTPLPART